MDNFEDGAAKQAEKRKTMETIHGSSEEGNAEGWCERRGCKG